jgi:hypothetical protein
MQIKFIHPSEDFSGYASLKALLAMKNMLSPMGNSATIPSGYILVTDGEWWNLEKV